MKTIATPRTHAPGWPVSQADQAVLAAVARFGYLTAAQLGRLLYPDCHDEFRYARRRLARLADAGWLLRLPGLPTPRYGSTPHVFTLGQAGRQLLGLAQRHFRPSEEQAKAANYLFMDHTLATVDVLVVAERLCHTAPVAMPRLRTERQLRASPLRVDLPAGEGRPARSVAVIPDAWFELAVAGRRPEPIAVELDRGTEDQKRWRGKVAALAAWAAGPYRQAFDAQTLTIAVVTSEAARRDTLRAWTARELTRRSQHQLAEIFLVTSADPVTTPPAQLFFDRCWYEPTRADPVSLLLAAPPLVTAGPVPGTQVWPAGSPTGPDSCPRSG